MEKDKPPTSAKAVGRALLQLTDQPRQLLPYTSPRKNNSLEKEAKAPLRLTVRVGDQGQDAVGRKPTFPRSISDGFTVYKLYD
jgi:hypothetical protein